MPRFVYKPEGVDPKSWDFDPAKMDNTDAEAIERHTGMTYGEWLEALGKSSMLALHGLLFVMLRKGVRGLKWDDVRFSISEIDVEMDDAEAAEALEALEAKVAGDESLTTEEAALWARLKEQAPAVPKG